MHLLFRCGPREILKGRTSRKRLPPEKPTRDNLKRLAALGGMATEMSLSVGAGTVFGYFLDKLFQTSPTLTIVFMFVGLVGGVITFIKVWRFLKDKILQ